MTEGRGLLTEREREVLLGDGSNSYRTKTRAYIRRRIKKIDSDVDFLKENAPNLLAELRVATCVADCKNPKFQGKYEGDHQYVFYRNGSKWAQDYYDSTSISWGEGGGDTGKAYTADILIRESLVKNMSNTYDILKAFVYEFGLHKHDEWEITAAEVRRWYKSEKLSNEE